MSDRADMQTLSHVRRDDCQKVQGLSSGLRSGIEPQEASPRTDSEFSFRSQRVIGPRELTLVWFTNALKTVGEYCVTGAASKKTLSIPDQQVFNFAAGYTTNRRPSCWTPPRLLTRSEYGLVDTLPRMAGIAKKSSNTSEGVGAS